MASDEKPYTFIEFVTQVLGQNPNANGDMFRSIDPTLREGTPLALNHEGQLVSAPVDPVGRFLMADSPVYDNVNLAWRSPVVPERVLVTKEEVDRFREAAIGPGERLNATVDELRAEMIRMSQGYTQLEKLISALATEVVKLQGDIRYWQETVVKRSGPTIPPRRPDAQKETQG